MNQVDDRPDLLKLMREDSSLAPDIYHTTNYWSFYEQMFIPELIEHGLTDFRRRYPSILNSFGATDLTPPWIIDVRQWLIFGNRIAHKIPFMNELLMLLNRILNKLLHLMPYYLNYVKSTSVRSSGSEAEKVGAKSVFEFEASLNGNPQDVINVGNKSYTTSMLIYYLRYVYCSGFLDFGNLNTLVELGSGSGKQIEVIRKLHPDICFFVFEIPPQLYVCEQYLSSVFPESVVSYKQTRESSFTPKIEKGKIYIIGNWRFPIVENLSIDLFWNSASFQEMEPNVVSHYLHFVNEKAKNCYLFEKMDGKELASDLEGGGVLEQSTIQDYYAGLSNMKLIDLSRAKYPKNSLLHIPLSRKVREKVIDKSKLSLEAPLLLQNISTAKGYRNSFWQRK